MGAKNRISVMVGKRKIYLEGEKSEQFLNRVQNYYNSLMDKILSETDYNRLDDDLKSALVSFNIIDDLLSAKDALQVAINDNKNKERENYSLNHDLGSLQIKYEALKKQYDDLERKSNYQKIKVESSLVTNAREEGSQTQTTNIRQQVIQSAQQRPIPVNNQNMQQNYIKGVQKETPQNVKPVVPVVSVNQNNVQIQKPLNQPQVASVSDALKKEAQKKNEEFMASINKTFGMSADAQKAAIEKAAQNFSNKPNTQNSGVSGNVPPNFNNALKPL